MYPEFFSHPKSAAAGRIAFRTVIVLVGLATADVLFWIGLDIAARLHWLPNNEFGER